MPDWISPQGFHGMRAFFQGSKNSLADDPPSSNPSCPDVTLTEPLLIWDKFNIYQGHRKNTPFIQIGRKRRSRRIRPPKEVNAIKQALAYRELLDTEQAHSQGELARLSGIPRTTVTAYLRLLRLDEEIQEFTLGLDDDDERLLRLTESRLRPLVGKDKRTQRQGLKRLVEAS